MSTWKPPRPVYHLRVFALSLVLVFAGLAGFLFGVRLEALAPATGIITARELQDVRALRAGLVEPGWCEGTLAETDGNRLRVRLDAEGNGLTNPLQGQPLLVRQFQVGGGDQRLRPDELRYHRLEPGDELWPGQVIAVIRSPEQPEGRGNASALLVPDGSDRWQVVEVPVARFQAVNAGDVIARIVPLDPETGRPRDLLARLDLDEKHCGDLAPGQPVRLYSAIYNHRLHGHAGAVLERLEPWGEPGANGERRFRAVARVMQAPFVLPLGSSVRAEVVVGRKAVYRIILEQ